MKAKRLKQTKHFAAIGATVGVLVLAFYVQTFRTWVKNVAFDDSSSQNSLLGAVIMTEPLHRSPFVHIESYQAENLATYGQIELFYSTQYVKSCSTSADRDDALNWIDFPIVLNTFSAKTQLFVSKGTTLTISCVGTNGTAGTDSIQII